MRSTILASKRGRKLRRGMTLPEVLFWRVLRRGDLNGLRFRRQHPIGVYILDFFCPSARLAVEIDGASHGYEEQSRRDAIRDAWLRSQRIQVLRVKAEDVLKKDGLDDVLRLIAGAASLR